LVRAYPPPSPPIPLTFALFVPSYSSPRPSLPTSARPRDLRPLPRRFPSPSLCLGARTLARVLARALPRARRPPPHPPPLPASLSRVGRRTGGTLDSPMCGPVTRAPVSPPRCPLQFALSLSLSLSPFLPASVTPSLSSPLSLSLSLSLSLACYTRRLRAHPPRRAYCTVHCNYARSPEIYSPLETHTACVCRIHGVARVWTCAHERVRARVRPAACAKRHTTTQNREASGKAKVEEQGERRAMEKARGRKRERKEKGTRERERTER